MGKAPCVFFVIIFRTGKFGLTKSQTSTRLFYFKLLTDGVMVAQRFLAPFVGVRVPIGQPLETRKRNWNATFCNSSFFCVYAHSTVFDVERTFLQRFTEPTRSTPFYGSYLWIRVIRIIFPSRNWFSTSFRKFQKSISIFILENR